MSAPRTNKGRRLERVLNVGVLVIAWVLVSALWVSTVWEWVLYHG